MLATSFGSLCPEVTNFVSQILATKFGFVPDWSEGNVPLRIVLILLEYTGLLWLVEPYIYFLMLVSIRISFWLCRFNTLHQSSVDGFLDRIVYWYASCASFTKTLPWVPGYQGVRKICISNAGTHGHTHQFSHSGQSRSRSWSITQYPITQTW